MDKLTQDEITKMVKEANEQREENQVLRDAVEIILARVMREDKPEERSATSFTRTVKMMPGYKCDLTIMFYRA